jgi:phage shock protein C
MPLYRSRKHKIIAGVCGGIAEWLGWDPTVVRIAYVSLWRVMPKEPAL